MFWHKSLTFNRHCTAKSRTAPPRQPLGKPAFYPHTATHKAAAHGNPCNMGLFSLSKGMANALNQFITETLTAATAGTLVKATLSQPTGAADDLKSVDIRPILVKRQLKLSFTYHYKTRDIVKNFTPPESAPLVANLLNSLFQSARLCTLAADIQLNGSTLTRHAPTQKQAPSLTHDKPKQHLVKATADSYLHALGLTDATGTVLKSAQDKFRQINKYVEIVDGLLKQLPADMPLKVVDMGAGKGYLTFALYDHLTRTLGRTAQVTGIESRQDMVDTCNRIAGQCKFSGLTFTRGTIADTSCTGATVVIALHACDTATDDALFKAITAGAQLIVAAPCCHKQIRRQLATPAPSHPLHSMLQFGTFAERTAEMLTDTLRALLLETNGYTTNVFEFIGTEHTPKNVMITAIHRQKPLPAAQTEALKQHIAALKSHYGITSQHLESLLAAQ